MKSVFLSAAVLCSIAFAAPLSPFDPTPPPTGTTFYTLQAKSSNTAVNSQWVALKTGGTTYAFTSTAAAAAKFFINQYQPTGTYSLHNSDDTRQVALQGANGTLLYVVDITNPTASSIPGGQLLEWSTFTIDSNNTLGVKDGSTLTSRTFVSVQDGTSYDVALYDGASATNAVISPVTLTVAKST